MEKSQKHRDRSCCSQCTAVHRYMQCNSISIKLHSTLLHCHRRLPWLDWEDFSAGLKKGRKLALCSQLQEVDPLTERGQFQLINLHLNPNSFIGVRRVVLLGGMQNHIQLAALKNHHSDNRGWLEWEWQSVVGDPWLVGDASDAVVSCCNCKICASRPPDFALILHSLCKSCNCASTIQICAKSLSP